MGLQWTEECQFLAERFERQLALIISDGGGGAVAFSHYDKKCAGVAQESYYSEIC
jgi:hypothetical protein